MISPPTRSRSCAPGSAARPARSPAALTRSRTTSSPSASWACPTSPTPTPTPPAGGRSPVADFGGDLGAFRLEARSWLEANFPASLRRGESAPAVDPEASQQPPTADQELWRRRMGEKGWGVPTWPMEYGGGGLTPAEARVLRDEMERIGAPNPIGGMGGGMFGPTLLEYGNE